MCPWSSFATPTEEPAFLTREGLDGPSLVEWMGMSQDDFSRRFKGSPIKRAKRRGCCATPRWRWATGASPEAVPALTAALDDEEPLVRGHAAWALGRIGTAEAIAGLRARAAAEDDGWVLEEIRLASGPHAGATSFSGR